MGSYGHAQMSPEIVLQVHAAYEKIKPKVLPIDSPKVDSPDPVIAPPSIPVTGAVLTPNTVEELEKLLSESENRRALVGSTSLLTNPLLESTKFFEPLENDSAEIKQEINFLSKLRALLLQNTEGFETGPFIDSCKNAGPYWIEYLMAQQTSETARNHTLTALLTAPPLFYAVLAAPITQKDPATVSYWGTHLEMKDSIAWGLRLTIADLYPSIEAEIMKPILSASSSLYFKLRNESPELLTDDDLMEALVALASPNKVRRSNSIQALTKSAKGAEVCTQFIDSSKEIRSLILSQYPLAKLKEMNTPYSLAAYYRRMGAEATSLNEKIKQFSLASETGVDGRECLKAILLLPEASEIIQAIPPRATHFGTLLQDLKEADPTQLQFLTAFFQKQGEKAKEGNLNSLSVLLLAVRNSVFQDTIGSIIGVLYSPEVSEKIVRITQGKIAAVAEEARQGNASALESIHVMTLDPEISMRDSAYETLAVLANIDPKARELVISMSKDKSASVRQLTVISLASKGLRKRELLVILLDATKDADPSVRSSACNSLIASALRNNEEATLALANLAENDPVDSVKQMAIRSLASSTTAGNTKAVDLLKKLASNSNPLISNTAKSALSEAPRS